jgi:hypothetical protein
MLSTPGDNIDFQAKLRSYVEFDSPPHSSLFLSCTPQATNSHRFPNKTANTGGFTRGTPLVMDQVPGEPEPALAYH